MVIIIGIYAGIILFFVFLVIFAPDGWEDAQGFHFGDKEDKK